jgi:hypothetical protein
MPAQTEYDIPAGWGTSPYVDLELPSGGKILAKRLDFEAIVAADLIDEFDKLSPAAEENVVGPAKGKKPADRQAKKPTKKQLAEQAAKEQREFFKSASFTGMVSIMSRLLPFVVIKPPVLSSVEKGPDGNWATIPPEDREEGRVYSDSIPLGDQMHIFSWCMEGMDMEGLQQFREQPESGVGAVQSGEESADSAE